MCLSKRGVKEKTPHANFLEQGTDKTHSVGTSNIKCISVLYFVQLRDSERKDEEMEKRRKRMGRDGEKERERERKRERE